MQLIVPILVDVYLASVITKVRIKTLPGLLEEGQQRRHGKNMDLSDASSVPDLPPPPIPVSPVVAAGIPGYKKLSLLLLDTRARFTGTESTDVDDVFVVLCWLEERISDATASKEIDGLLQFAPDKTQSSKWSSMSFCEALADVP